MPDNRHEINRIIPLAQLFSFDETKGSKRLPYMTIPSGCSKVLSGICSPYLNSLDCQCPYKENCRHYHPAWGFQLLIWSIISTPPQKYKDKGKMSLFIFTCRQELKSFSKPAKIFCDLHRFLHQHAVPRLLPKLHCP